MRWRLLWATVLFVDLTDRGTVEHSSPIIAGCHSTGRAVPLLLPCKTVAVRRLVLLPVCRVIDIDCDLRLMDEAWWRGCRGVNRSTSTNIGAANQCSVSHLQLLDVVSST